MSGNTTRSKGQCHTGHLIFLSCPLHGFRLIWPNHFICVIHSYTTHNEAMCRAPFLWQKIKGQGHMGRFKFVPVRSVASSLIDWTTSYVAYIQRMRRRCVVPHLHDKRSKVKVTWVVSISGPVWYVASSLFGWITSYVAYMQHMRGQCVAHHFQDERSKSKSQESFKVFT